MIFRTILGEYLARVKTALNPHYDEVSSTVFKMRDKYLQHEQKQKQRKTKTKTKKDKLIKNKK